MQKEKEAAIEMQKLSGCPSNWFFGTYGGDRGEMVAKATIENGKIFPSTTETVVVAHRVENRRFFGDEKNYAAWGIENTPTVERCWVATPDGVAILIWWKTRQAKIAAACAKAAQMKREREKREREAMREREKIERMERENRRQTEPTPVMDRPAQQPSFAVKLQGLENWK